MCDIGKCKRPNMLIYAAFGEGRNKEVEVCEYHWEKHCDDDDKFDLHEYFYPSKSRRLQKEPK